ncbi:MAG: SusC/RagA family protein [Chitinophagaceae bacterium]|nr:SusC/RagA family protein [Chitinophagaceae bacterium]
MKITFTYYKTLFFLIALLAGSTAYSQTVVRGRISDSTSTESLAEVIVNIKGGTDGTTTDSTGHFEFTTEQTPPFILQINSLGYKPKEVEFNGQPIQTSIEFDGSEVEEVVVVGYGTQKKKDITGSVSSVSKEQMAQAVSSPDRLIQGSVSGAQVTQSSGQPGSGVSIQIRGIGSLNGGQPLYVIDGFPIYNDPSTMDAGVTYGTYNTNTTGVAPQINPMSSINPSDIESIDVLKDASSTAIYGSRGANGVILVTTKKGSYNKSSINFDSYIGVQNVIKTIPVINGSQWGALANDAAVNSGKAAPYTQAQVDAFGEGTNWQSEAFRQAKIENYNVSILSGSEKTRIAISGNYFKQNGVLLNTWFRRYAGRFNIEHDYSEKFKIGAFVTASNISSQVAPQNVVPAILAMPPSVPLYNADGTYTVKSPYQASYGNPINSLVSDINTTTTNRVLANGYGEYTIIPGLTAKILGGIDLIGNKQNAYLPSTTFEGSGSSGVASVGSLTSRNWLNENTLHYARRIGDKHAFDVLGGFMQQSSYSESSIANAAGFASDAYTYNNLGSGTTQVTPSSIQSASALQSFLLRANYSYDDKYLFTVTARADGSSRFAKGHQWGTFPSAAIGWNVHNEGFLKDVTQISQLKLRFSAGLTGNTQIPPYSSLSQMGYYRYNFGNTTIAGFAPFTQQNKNLTWEKTTQYNLGVDVGLLKNRIIVVADIYYKKTNNLLLNVTLPATTGLLNYAPSSLQSQAIENAGSMTNKGIELAVTTKNLTGKLTWNTSLVFSHNDNRVTALNGDNQQYIPNSASPSILQVGYSVGSFIVYETDGLIQPGTLPANALTPGADKGVGAQQYKDQNGDGKITSEDRIIINNQPKFIAGLTNTFGYKGFDLTIFFQGVYGNKIYNANAANLGLETGYQGASTDVLNRWTPTNTNTDVPRAYQDPAAILSSRYIEDGSFLRLKNIALGYTIPKSIVSKAKIQNLRVYVSLQNYLTWTKYTGFDPEVGVNGQNAMSTGVDNGAYPNYKTILGGLSFSF